MASVTFKAIAKQFPGGEAAVSDLSLDIASGEFLVLLGPSGCGKSTALRLLAGLEDPTSGDLLIDGLRVNDVPAGGRELGMVFQSYALYPHMTVRENLTFGLRNGPRKSRLDNAEIVRRADEAIDLLDLGALTERLPKELSGGQQQRVAIGRALAKRPKVLLMDEPLSNLDAKLRNRMRFELRRLHERHGTTTVYVTHDQVEAMTLADRMAVLNAGELQQVDTPLEVYRNPANAFVAGFIGSPPMNLIEGEAKDGVLQVGEMVLALPEHLVGSRGKGSLGIRPEDIDVVSEGGVPVTLEGEEHLGGERILHFNLEGQWMRMRANPMGEGNDLVVGQGIQVSVASKKARFFGDHEK